MRFINKFFSKTANIITACVIAAISVIAVSAALISGTFAAVNDITDTFNPVNDTYVKIAVNEKNSDVRGTKMAISSNVTILSTDTTRTPPELTGVSPGVATVAFLTSIGTGRNINYQVYDPNGIAGYRIPGGKMEVSQTGGDPQELSLTVYIDTENDGNKTEMYLSDWNSGHPNNKVTWKSLQPDIVSVDPASGDFTALAKGSAILAGTVTDKWGVKQSISVLISVGDGGGDDDGGNVPPTPGIINDAPEAVNGRILTPDKTGDNANWVEIARNGGYSLILRADYINVYTSGHNNEYAWQHIYYGSTDYTTSTVRNKINDWFNGKAGGTADNLPATAALRKYTMQNDAYYVPGYCSGEWLTFGFSKPTDIKIPSGSQDVAFALSYGEAANFCSMLYFVRGPVANQESSAIAKANFAKINIPNVYLYGMWLRSPGDIDQTMGFLAGPFGSVPGRVFQSYTTDTASQGLVYPALWVDSSIFSS